jgi:fructose-specific phosphotransferase system component IIB
VIEALKQAREALHALTDRNFTFFAGGMVGADKKITRDEVLAARAAIASIDAELKRAPTGEKP